MCKKSLEFAASVPSAAPNLRKSAANSKLSGVAGQPFFVFLVIFFYFTCVYLYFILLLKNQYGSDRTGTDNFGLAP
jgi:hypothetical protein